MEAHNVSNLPLQRDTALLYRQVLHTATSRRLLETACSAGISPTVKTCSPISIFRRVGHQRQFHSNPSPAQ